MELNLSKPLIIFDLETTGINVTKDRIVEIALLKIHPNGKEEEKTYRINPTIPIPKDASSIHHIYDEDVKDAPTFKEVGKEIAQFIEGCDLAGFNSNKFDIPLLAEEFLREDINFDMHKRRFVDVQTIFHKMEQRTLSAAYQFYCNQNLENAHSAMADTRATYEVLKAQISRYESLKNDVDYLSQFSNHQKTADLMGRVILNKHDQEVINFGKYKGETIESVLEKDPGYYGWLMNADFPLYTKKIFTEVRLRSFNKK
ncbi:MAG: 3'-5' exonuclease [Bacteroidales bacterium]|nr:3'-5' exonuclease [Bacteroidales bacterium]